jgi:integrase
MPNWRAYGKPQRPSVIPAAPFICMLLLTGQRLREVAGMAWDEIDLDKELWTIPAGRMKAGITHVIPIAPQKNLWEGLFLAMTGWGVRRKHFACQFRRSMRG